MLLKMTRSVLYLFLFAIAAARGIPVSVEFVETLHHYPENIRPVVLVRMNGSTSTYVNVSLMIVNDTAYSGLDFTVSERTLTFPPTSLNQSLVEFRVNVIDDDLIEEEERFKLIVETNQAGVTIGPRNEAVFLICNNEVSVEFMQPVYYVGEKSSAVTLWLKKVGWDIEIAQVGLSTVDITAKAGKDYVGLTNKVISFPTRSSEATINTTIQILEDAVVEGNETFKVYLNVSVPQSGGLVVKLGTQNETKIIITDDDKERATTIAQFKEQYNIEVEENLKEGKMDLTCVIDGTPNVPVQISFLVNPDKIGTTAKEGEDFSLRNKSLTFQPGVQSLPLTIDINRDQKAESSEIFVIKMTSVNGSSVVIGRNDTATVKIGDKFDQEEAAKDRQEREKLDERRQTLLNFLVAAIVLVGIVIVVLIILVICICLARK